MIELYNDDSITFDWGAKLQGRKIDCIVTDPPYGMGYLSNYGLTETFRAYAKKVDADEDVQSALARFVAVMANLTPHLADDVDMYVFTSPKVIEYWMPLFKTGLIEDFGAVSNILVWDKHWGYLGDYLGNWPMGHEFVLYIKKGRHAINDPKKHSVIHDVRQSTTHGRRHPTQKPEYVLGEYIKQSTDPGDLVVDPFAGSASTLLAARSAGRDAIGVELDTDHYNKAMDAMSQQSLFSQDRITS